MANRMDAAIEAIARTQHGLFTPEQAREAGATKDALLHRLRVRRWVRVRPGVLGLLGLQMTPVVALHAEVLAGGPGTVASHTSAAAVLSLDGFRLHLQALHVSVPTYNLRRRTRAVVHRTLQLPDRHVTTAEGLPCTSVARTVFDLCGLLRPGHAERVLDRAIAQRRVTVPALGRVLEEVGARGRSGTAVLRALLDERGADYVPPESELESRFLELVRSYTLPIPVRQLDVGDADTWIGRVDFAYRDARLVVELDGAAWHTSLTDRRADRARDARLVQSGWRVLRLDWDDVVDRPARTAARLREALCTVTEPISRAIGAPGR